MIDWTMDTLAPGVEGYLIEKDGELWIPMIAATRPGAGQVSAYLDGLPRDQTICFPNLVSARLALMLARRGFRPEYRWIEEAGESVEVFVRYAEPAPE